MKAKRAFPVMRISMSLIPFTIIVLTVFLSSFAASEDANVILSNKISLRTTATPDHIYSSGIFYDDLSSFIVYSTIINDDMNSLIRSPRPRCWRFVRVAISMARERISCSSRT